MRKLYLISSAVMPEGKNIGVPVVIGGDIFPSPVEIGLKNLPNIKGGSSPPAPPPPVPASL